MKQALPVSLQTVKWQQKGVTIYFPQLIDLRDRKIMKNVNRIIEMAVRQLIKDQYKQQGLPNFDQMIGMYEVKTNERNILSLSLSNYAISKHAAHGLTLMTSLTFDLKSGKQIMLGDLFKPGSHYVNRLSDIISEQIYERDIPLLNGFTEISPNQDFYLADKALIIYFQLYEITPHYFGFPMFPISIYDVEDIMLEKGLLDRLLQ